MISNHPNRFTAEVLTAQSNYEKLIHLAIKFQPNAVVIADCVYYQKVTEALAPYSIKVFCGEESLCEVVRWKNVDLILNALVGFSGLSPTLSALSSGKPVALANKESLVAGGSLVMEAALLHNAPIFPVDSEHSAIFQCLAAQEGQIEKLILTASGGPFFRTPENELPFIQKEQALNHPSWKMGKKVTIDSATMMNKGLEVIEAHWLFGVPASKIDIIIHPQSIIHSMVQFVDGSVKAQMSHPDMRIPILYALSFPERLHLDTPRIQFDLLGNLAFFPLDTRRFPSISLAYTALEKGGNMPCFLNAANEVAVHAFLNDRLSFHHIPDLIEKSMLAASYIPYPTLADIVETNSQARLLAQNLLKTY